MDKDKNKDRDWNGGLIDISEAQGKMES